ncbi:MAG: methionine--tRNA ligase [Bacteroidetes bacterium]|nr:methionine--tRNA ligase [Bacteroidota bacterium]MCW5897387.1 methionine--tRNA ligase [Bacteroidota bacterium]
MAECILVTAALPYANGPIHLGHLAGAYLPSDIYVRFQRLKGREVVFICGSDEHGVPITLTADKEGITPQAVVDRYHAMNKAAFERFSMSFDNYSRTSLPLHHVTALEFFLDFHKRGILREKKERQFFDPKANMFLPDRYVEGTCPVCSNPEARGDQCERCGSYLNPTELINPKSKISGEVPVLRETSHLYFPLGDYQKKLESYIDARNKRDGWKDNVLKYCQSWFKEGLQDRAVTRDLDWGVKTPLPGYESKVLYVWFDAVLGYISSTKEWSQRIGKPDEWKKFWLDESTKYVAFIGKDNVVFHCIVFPAMLMAWNETHPKKYVLPGNVPANEFLNFEGQKFSKSRGIGIDVQDFLERFPADPLRYYLASSLPEYRDSDFYWKDFQSKNNNELADILGNFVNRTLAFAGRTFNGVVPERGDITSLDQTILDALKATPTAAGQCFEEYRFRDALLEVMNLARAANKYFNDSEPWKTAKSDTPRCATTINVSIQIARSLAVLMFPFIPSSCEKIWRMLALEGAAAAQSWGSAGSAVIPSGHKLGTPEILFTKIEDDVIEQAIRETTNQQPAQAPAAAAKQVEEEPSITIDDFKKVELRVAKILECEAVPKSEKLLKLQVEIGKEKRQIVAGIAKHYKPEDLIGKSVVVVYNLQPAKLMGQESKGMILAASDDDGRLFVVSPSGEIASGSVVR